MKVPNFLQILNVLYVDIRQKTLSQFTRDNMIKYIGVNDHEIDLFEGQFEVPNGMAYNSYLILADKIAVMDSVEEKFGQEWLSKLEKELSQAGAQAPDYLIVQHMEMDHSSSINLFLEKYPQAKIVASKMAFTIMKNLFGSDYPQQDSSATPT